MSCASCAVNIERIIGAQKRKINKSINFASATVRVEYVRTLVQPADFQKSAQSGGYDLVIESDKNKTETLGEIHQKKYDRLKWRTIGATLLSLLFSWKGSWKKRPKEILPLHSKKLMGLQPKTVTIITPGGTHKQIPVEEVNKDDFILVKPGEKIAVDGKVTHFESLTGSDAKATAEGKTWLAGNQKLLEEKNIASGACSFLFFKPNNNEKINSFGWKNKRTSQ